MMVVRIGTMLRSQIPQGSTERGIRARFDQLVKLVCRAYRRCGASIAARCPSLSPEPRGASIREQIIARGWAIGGRASRRRHRVTA